MDEYAYACYKLDQDDEAIVYYNKSIAIKADNSTPYLGLGDVYKNIRKDNDEALKNYKKAATLNVKSKKANYEAGWLYNDKADYDNAIYYLEKVVKIDPKYTAAFTELGYAYYKKANYASAISTLKNSIDQSPKSELAHYYTGLCYYMQYDKTNLRKEYEALKSLSSKYADELKGYLDK